MSSIAPCSVCVLVDKDTTPKDVSYCKRCMAFLCDRCFKSATRRAEAMVKRQIQEYRQKRGLA